MNQTLVLMEQLRSLEATFAERGLLDWREGRPLWFFACRERDLYLWRHGMSIGDASKFEFWFDVADFIRTQVEDGSGSRGGVGLNSTCTEEEIEYLREFEALLERAQGTLDSLRAILEDDSLFRVVLPRREGKAAEGFGAERAHDARM